MTVRTYLYYQTSHQFLPDPVISCSDKNMRSTHNLLTFGHPRPLEIVPALSLSILVIVASFSSRENFFRKVIFVETSLPTTQKRSWSDHGDNSYLNGSEQMYFGKRHVSQVNVVRLMLLRHEEESDSVHELHAPEGCHAHVHEHAVQHRHWNVLKREMTI